jgi:hypothetical protein
MSKIASSCFNRRARFAAAAHEDGARSSRSSARVKCTRPAVVRPFTCDDKHVVECRGESPQFSSARSWLKTPSPTLPCLPGKVAARRRRSSLQVIAQRLTRGLKCRARTTIFAFGVQLGYALPPPVGRRRFLCDKEARCSPGDSKFFPCAALLQLLYSARWSCRKTPFLHGNKLFNCLC